MSPKGLVVAKKLTNMGKLKEKFIEEMEDAYNENNPDKYEGLNNQELIREFNKESAIGVAVQALVKKYPNNQELGEAIRSLVNSFE